jgi:AcrR family transcriptional regulator
MNMRTATKRRYEMRERAASAEATRARIIDATTELALDRWYDEITLKDIAAVAGVALQTVVNHFGTKEGIFTAALDQPPHPALTTRLGATPDDIEGAIGLLIADYEFAGDAIIRTLALEHRVPSLKPTLERGRELHREWVRDTFPSALAGLKGAAIERRLDLLVCATDVYTWKLLRRDRGLSRAKTAEAIHELVEAVIR